MPPRDRGYSLKDDLYLGRWRLIPELCIYQHGEVPLSGTYEIVEATDTITISIEWRNPDGSDQQVSFSGTPDGSRQMIDTPGTSAFALNRINGSILDSSAYLAEEEVAYARRLASRDGSLLSTLQAGTSPDGTSFQNFQVYRRDDT